MRPSVKINEMTEKEFSQLPIGAKLIESFGSGYRYIRAIKSSPTHVKGLVCRPNDEGNWEYEAMEEQFSEEFSEIEQGDFDFSDFPEKYF